MQQAADAAMAATLADHAAIYQAIASASVVYNRKLRIVLFVLAALTIGALVIWPNLLPLTPVVLMIAWVLWRTREDPDRWLQAEEYYAIRGSSDGRGHRCIWCGHRGIWRSTQYQTADTYASCSNCRNSLFRE